MDFAFDATTLELRERLLAFMDECVYPAEPRFRAEVERSEQPWGTPPVIEELKAHARDRAADMHVLTVRGVESEAELPFAGLHRLLRPALHLVSQLPTPQGQALKGALGLAESSTQERFLVFAACLSLLSELAERLNQERMSRTGPSSPHVAEKRFAKSSR